MPRPRIPVATSERLSQFRGQRQPLPIGDKRVLVVLIVHLCFLPWALGAMRPWAQVTSLVLAAIGLLVALTSGDRLVEAGRPVPDGASLPPQGRPPSTPLRRLLKFPPFWIGLALLGYIALQGFNPSWRYVTDGSMWWLKRVSNISWLPTSIDTPFARFNLWRQFIIYAAAWLALCTVAIGLTRRRSFVLLLSALAANGLVLVLVGVIVRLTRKPGQVLWLEEKIRGATSFASFIYKNHAGAYFALIAVVMLVLAARYRERALREHARSSPAMLGVLGALMMLFAVVFTYSRGATLLLLVYLITAGAVFVFYRTITGTGSSTPRIVTFTIGAMVAFVIAFALAQVDFDRVMNSFEKLAASERRDVSVKQRLEANQASRDMLAATWPRGVGAGGFRHVFPEYVRRFSGSYNNYSGGRLFWEHAHNDWLQIPIEQGLVGTVLLAAGLGWGCWRLVRTRIWQRLPPLLLVLGLLQTPVHAAIDFPFQNPAILTTWLVLATMAVRFNDRQVDG